MTSGVSLHWGWYPGEPSFKAVDDVNSSGLDPTFSTRNRRVSSILLSRSLTPDRGLATNEFHLNVELIFWARSHFSSSNFVDTINLEFQA